MSKNKLGKENKLSDFQRQMILGLLGESDKVVRPKSKIRMAIADPFFSGVQTREPLTKDDVKAHSQAVAESNPLLKSVLNVLNGGPGDTIERLAFETQPAVSNTYGGLWKKKLRLLPDDVLKRIAIQDDLVAAIVNTRSSQMAAFGRPQPDRFSTGMKIEAEPGYTDQLSAEQKEQLRDQIAKAEAKLLTCGETRGWSDDEALNLGQFLFMSARNAAVFGRIATEVIYVETPTGRKAHSFRPIDAGTIYRAAPYKEQGDSVRKEALRTLESLKNKRLKPERFVADEYSWVQVIEGRPVQAFTSEECLVHSFYPTTDVELDGYPITPLDTVITAVTTHINIGTHNKLYFQSGRAAKGMLVIKSDEVDDATIEFVKQQFNASINSVGNSWRMPVFGVGSEDELSWQPIDSGGRDMEFQYLSDTNARVVLSAFQMSPEELPGYAHLCLSPESLVWTHKGAASIGSLLGDQKEVGGFSVWTGKNWSEARAFVTGNRPVRKTIISNGVTLTTSPEHRFRVVDNQGELVWKEQRDLVIGDTVLVNRNPTPGFECNIPLYDGKRLTPEMAEVLGWLTGDGSINVARRGKTKHSKSLEFYYHHERELELRERHFKILQQFGLNPKIKDRQLTLAQVERQKDQFGFKSVSSFKTSLCLYDTKFVQWLLDLGFRPSTEHKAVPAFLHGLPVEFRGAFLRGFFSADGSCDKLSTPSISIASEQTREETKALLLSLGIRTRSCEGTHRTRITKNAEGKYDKTYVREPSRLVIKDKHEFFDKVGFLQPHKQPNKEALAASGRRWDRVARSVAVAVCDKLLATNLVVGHEARDRVRHALKDSLTPYREIDNVRSVIGEYGFDLPEWTREFYQESVIGLESSDEDMEMVDIEVFDDIHAFMASGVVVHNSRGTNNQALSESNNEYKLEAHRDVGIRPLIGQFQNFLNSRIFPLFFPELAKFCHIRFVGLDAETAEKESVRIQQDMAVHMTMDEVLEKVEKNPVGRRWAGSFLLNPQWQAVLDKYFLQGDIMEYFFGIEGASKDPRFQFVNNPMWFQWQQLQMEMKQIEMQQQQVEAQAQAQQGQPGQPQQQQGQDPNQPQQQQQQGGGGELTGSLQQLEGVMSKSEQQLTSDKKRLLVQQKKIVADALKTMEAEAKKETANILKELRNLLPD